MIFWDTSAIVPLLVRERGTAAVRRALEGDPEMVVWWATSVEALSAIARQERAGKLSATRAAQARRRLDRLRTLWSEVEAVEEVSDRAADVVLRHPLRAADALQLAAAATWAGGLPRGHRFMSLDDRLARAAGDEGFTLAGSGS